MSASEITLQQPAGDLARSALFPPQVLVVEGEAIDRDILVRKLTSMGYACDSCGDGVAALDMLTGRDYDLVVSNLMVRPVDGTDLLKRALRLQPDTAVILLAGIADIGTAVASLKDGAYDYIVKPYSLEEITAGVNRALEKRRLVIENRNHQRTLEAQVAGRTRQLKQALDVLEQTYRSTLMALSTALDTREPDSAGHSLRVTLYSIRLARELGLDDARMRVIEQGALLHDIGKIGIPDQLLRKPDKLTESEWVLMRRHPEIGFRILSGIGFLQDAAQIVLQHQERYDGMGYPAGLKTDQIIPGARIFSVADTLDGMTSSRPFQAATTFDAAREMIPALAGNQLDPEVVEAFLNISLDEWLEIRKEVAAKLELERNKRAAAESEMHVLRESILVGG